MKKILLLILILISFPLTAFYRRKKNPYQRKWKRKNLKGERMLSFIIYVAKRIKAIRSYKHWEEQRENELKTLKEGG